MFDLQYVDILGPAAAQQPLCFGGQNMNEFGAFDEVDQETLLKVLETQATLAAVRSLLKAKGVSYSASSWSKMLATRIKPALENGSISNADLIGVIRVAEEHGNKHVRLFRYNVENLTELSDAISDTAVSAWGEANGYPMAGQYVFAAYPETPTVTEIRVGDNGSDGSFILKIARTENRRKRAVLQEIDGSEFFVAERVSYRAVDVVKIHLDGLIEVRMDPRSEPPISYSGSALAALKFLDGLVDRSLIGELSLAKAKSAFSELHKEGASSEDFELYEASLKNDWGDRILSSSQVEQGGMASSTVMPGIIELFTVGGHDPYCERVRVSYKFEGVKKINAILTEDINEIIFTAQLSREEHEGVLGAILDVNSAS